MSKILDAEQDGDSKLENIDNETITEEEAAREDNLHVSKDKYHRLKSKFNGLKEVRAHTGTIYLNVNQTTLFPQEYMKILGSWEHTNAEVRKLNAERR